MTEKIAEITVDPRTRDVTNLSFSQTSLKFKCQRCAVFCCKCGGPKLSLEDVENLKSSRKRSNLFIHSGTLTMKNKKDGSCIFLSADSDEVCKCSVYTTRPALCRIYPFQFERLGEHSFALNLIPCCNGLNANDGEPVDERFFEKHLRKPFLDILAGGQY